MRGINNGLFESDIDPRFHTSSWDKPFLPVRTASFEDRNIYEFLFVQGGGGGQQQSNLNTGRMAKFDSNKFFDCLSEFFPGVKPAYMDDWYGDDYGQKAFGGIGGVVGVGFNNGNQWLGDIGSGVVTAVNFISSKNSNQLGNDYRKIDPSFKGPQSGYVIGSRPRDAYIASDIVEGVRLGAYKSVGLQALQIHELGNALGFLSHSGAWKANVPQRWNNRRIAIGIKKDHDDSGAAFETCVFGGFVGLISGRIGNNREAP
jgi:hypothetical protein